MRPHIQNKIEVEEPRKKLWGFKKRVVLYSTLLLLGTSFLIAVSLIKPHKPRPTGQNSSTYSTYTEEAEKGPLFLESDSRQTVADYDKNLIRHSSDFSPSGFRLAVPGFKFSFPRDHGSHPQYQTEWWYYTGHLKAKNGAQRFGYQLTFFRTALLPKLNNRPSSWAARDVILAHFAMTDETGQSFYFADRISRAALDLARAKQISPAEIWLGRWKMNFINNGQAQKISASARSEGSDVPFAINLNLSSAKSPAIHGENGVSQKSAGRGRASHYYSFTRLKTSGTIKLNGQDYSVVGDSWFDHEFGSNQLAPNQTGWDWFSIQLDDGREFMLYQLRLKSENPSGAIDPYSSGTIVQKDGSTSHLKVSDFQIEVLDWWRSPNSKSSYPARWKVKIPQKNIELHIEPTVSDQELNTARSTGITYWEGSVRVQGNQGARVLSGRGYVELTGYAEKFNGTF